MDTTHNENMDTFHVNGIRYFVSGTWLHRWCIDITREDMESRGEDMDNLGSYADALYENMSEDTAADMLRDASRSVRASKLRSDNSHANTVLLFLERTQDTLHEHKVDNAITVGLVYDSCPTDEEPLEVLLEGTIYSNYISCMEAYDTVHAIVTGMELNTVRKETAAGTIYAEASDAPDGISLYFVPNGTEEKVNLALAATGKSVEDLALYVYGEPKKGEPTKQFDYPRAGVLNTAKESD